MGLNGTRHDSAPACRLCLRPMYYMNWGAGLITMHEETHEFLCPDEPINKENNNGS